MKAILMKIPAAVLAAALLAVVPAPSAAAACITRECRNQCYQYNRNLPDRPGGECGGCLGGHEPMANHYAEARDDPFMRHFCVVTEAEMRDREEDIASKLRAIEEGRWAPLFPPRMRVSESFVVERHFIRRKNPAHAWLADRRNHRRLLEHHRKMVPHDWSWQW